MIIILSRLYNICFSFGMTYLNSFIAIASSCKLPKGMSGSETGLEINFLDY